MANKMLDLNGSDIKSAVIAIAIAAGGAMYWKWKQSGNGSGVTGLLSKNTQSAASGSAGAIAPSSTINTYNVFPTVSSQQSTGNAFFNGPHGPTGPSSLNPNAVVTLTNGQGFSLPVMT